MIQCISGYNLLTYFFDFWSNGSNNIQFNTTQLGYYCISCDPCHAKHYCVSLSYIHEFLGSLRSKSLVDTILDNLRKYSFDFFQ